MSKRAPVVIGTTVAGLAGILAFHTHATSGQLATGSSEATPVSPSGRAPRRSASSAAAGSSGGASSSGAAGSAGGASSAGGAGSSASSSAGPASSRTVTGPVVAYGYGQLAVQVTETGGRITAVTVTDLQVAEPTSAQIADEAVPILRREVLSAQSANIAGVSGATYTSQAFAESLQAALSNRG
jgi:hypothetical protein